MVDETEKSRLFPARIAIKAHTRALIDLSSPELNVFSSAAIARSSVLPLSLAKMIYGG